MIIVHLIVSRGLLQPLVLSSLPDRLSIAYSCGCRYIFSIYNIFITLDVNVMIFMASPLWFAIIPRSS